MLSLKYCRPQMWHTSPCGAMGVSKDAAGLPWKRDTTMERGGGHYSNDEQLGQLVGAKQLESSTTC